MILFVEQLSSGRSTPVIIPEPDVIAIDDDQLTVTTESLRSISPPLILPYNDVPVQESVRSGGHARDLTLGSRNVKSGKHVERMRQARQKAVERKELERKVVLLLLAQRRNLLISN